MRPRPVSDPFDQRRTQMSASSFNGPFGRREDSQKIVAVHSQRGNATANASCGKRGAFASGQGLKGGNGPLIVDDVKNNRRLVHMSERQCSLKVGGGGCPIAYPGRCNFAVALYGRGHGPAHSLHKLRRQVSRYRKKTAPANGTKY